MSVYELHHGDCLDVLRGMADNSVDSIVTDPPYGLSFMGKKWDYDVPSVDVWRECLRVLKPGGHLLAFAGTRTQHRMAVRIEDAGFEIRDMIAWTYGSGFPKSMDVSKQLDKVDATETRRDRALRFTAWVRSTGLTSARIDELTGTSMGSHYTTASSQPAVATREHFEKLRPHLGCDVPAWVEEMVDWRTVESENFKRREVVGHVEMTDTSVARPAVAYSSQGLADVGRRLVAITEPHTDAARQWKGWGTALKPALEPITVARKPLVGTVAENVLAHGTGALNIDGCRVEAEAGGRPLLEVAALRDDVQYRGNALAGRVNGSLASSKAAGLTDLGRWPANLIHDGHPDVVALFPCEADGVAPVRGVPVAAAHGFTAADLGSAARFFYCAKPDREDRDAGLHGREQAKTGDGRKVDCDNAFQRGATLRSNTHPTVKPTDLMRYLCRLVTPPGGTVLDPFNGSGSTGKGAVLEGFRYIGMDREAEYLEISRARIEHALVLAKAGADVLKPAAARDPHTVDLFGAD